MANEYVNHVVVNGQSILDLRGDTVDAASVLQGKTFHDKSGAALVGTYSGGGPAPTPAQPVVSGVEFIDYDGTLVASWPTAEVASKTALPSNPDHSSDIQWGGHTIALTSQGWNWSLADIKSWVTAHANEVLAVGQMYKPTDNKLHICVQIPNELLNVASRFKFTGSATIDWGDGTAPVSAVSNANNTHTYASSGEYDVAVTPSATLDITGSVTISYLFVNPNSTSLAPNKPYINCIHRVFIPNAVTSIGNRAFYYSTSLRSVTIPNAVTSVETGVFYYCTSLQGVTIPNSVTSIGSSEFQSCASLRSVTIPNAVTSIGSHAFYGCYSLQSIFIPNAVTSIEASSLQGCYPLRSVTIPNAVTSIGAYAFSSCTALMYIRFTQSTPPTVANANAWNSVPTDCKIYVPAASLNAYKTATNYPSPSTYTYVGY